jgi:hypothetical protein
LLARAGGESTLACSFELVFVVAQVTVSLLNGIGVGLKLEPGSSAAIWQVVAVAAVQLSAVAWVVCVNGCADRLDGSVVGIQFALEAGQTITLLMHSIRAAPAMEQASFILALSALFAPILQQIYDAVIVQLSLAARRDGGFSLRAAFCESLSLICLVPKVLLKLLGVHTYDGSANMAIEGGESMKKMAELSHDEKRNSVTLQLRESQKDMREASQEYEPPVLSSADVGQITLSEVQFIPMKNRRKTMPSDRRPRPGFEWVEDEVAAADAR